MRQLNGGGGRRRRIISGFAVWLLLPAMSGVAAPAAPRLKVLGASQREMGKFPVNRVPSVRFLLINAGDAPLRITGIGADCNCLKMHPDRREAGPGEKIVLTVRLLPERSRGRFVRNILIRSNAAGAPTVLSLSGEGVFPLEVTPSDRLYAGHVRQGETWTGTWLLHRTEAGATPGIPQVKADFPVTVELRPEAEGRWRLTAKMTATRIGHEFQGRIFLPVTSPSGRQELELAFRGRMGREMAADPTRLFIPADPRVPFVRRFELFLAGEDAPPEGGKLVFPVLPRTGFRVVGTVGGERRRVVVEMRRERGTDGDEYDCRKVPVAFPGASAVEIELIPAKFLRQ
ncbi:MAG: DUF1573 domain-containing protein [Victivallales bacterium]|nr:DUF1573 domain-containing protein [Victivallales bacterium]